MRSVVLLSLLILATSSEPLRFAVNAQSKPEWKYVVTSEDDNKVWKTYYDAANIDRQRSGTVRVWLKQLPITKTDAERQRIISSLIENRKLNNMRVKGYERFAYSLTLVEYDCVGREGRSISIKDYDQGGKLLGQDTIEGMPFAPVVDGSMSAMVLEAACK